MAVLNLFSKFILSQTYLDQCSLSEFSNRVHPSQYNCAGFQFVASSEGKCGDEGIDSGNERNSSGEGDVESEWTGLSAVIDENLSDALFDGDNIANLGLVILNTEERGIVENNSRNSSSCVDFHSALST